MKYIPILIIGVLLASCANKQNQIDTWANTTWTQLTQENIKLRVPDNFKQSSRFRIKEDLPRLGEDSTKLSLVLKSLHLLEFEDSEIDVFIDTSKAYRLVIVSNVPKIDFN